MRQYNIGDIVRFDKKLIIDNMKGIALIISKGKTPGSFKLYGIRLIYQENNLWNPKYLFADEINGKIV